MHTFVLVPGAWLGARIWRAVIEELTRLGHRADALTLCGIAERFGEADESVNLDTHVQDVVEHMTSTNLHDVILVGHSYAGSVVAGAADRVPERVRAVIYVDTAPLADGQSMLDFYGAEMAGYLRQQVQTEGRGWLLPPVDFKRLSGPTADGLTPTDLAKLAESATPQPFATYAEPFHVSNRIEDIPAAVVACHDYRSMSGAPAIERLAVWPRKDLDTGHWPMISRPVELATALIQFAEEVV